MKRIYIIVLLLLCAVGVSAQTTTVTLQATDADGQAWNNGSWTASLYSPPGVPNGPYVITGGSTPVPNQSQSGLLNGSGGASLTVTPNTSISPSGTQWMFVFSPQAAPAQSSQVPIGVSGTTQTVAPALPAIRLSVSNPIVRVTAYLDLEVTGAAIGSTYFNLTDLTIHVCTTFVAPSCTAWSVIGTGGGGGGGITGLTPLVIPQAATSTTIQNSSPQLDNGLTTANQLTYAGQAIAIPSNGVNAGSVQFGGNTTLPQSFLSNAVGFIGPNSASFTNYFFQLPTTLPALGQSFVFGTPAGSPAVVPVTYGSPGVSLQTQPGYWLSGDGTPFSLSTQLGQFGSSTANQLKCMLSRVPGTLTVNNLSFRLNQTGPASSHIALGVYDVNKNKVYSWDNINAVIGSPTNFQNTITTVIMQPGLYWMCTAGDYNGTGAASEGGYVIPSSSYVASNNVFGVRIGTAANALSGGAMPATLGAISANTFGQFAAWSMEP